MREKTFYILFTSLFTFLVTGNTDDSNINDKETGMPILFRQDMSVSNEYLTHSNRVMGCDDHPGAAQVCMYAERHPCQCEENESYMFSFCRKSCKYCNPNYKKYYIWRIRAKSEFWPTWNISNIEFYDDYGSNESLTKSQPDELFYVNSGAAISSSNYRTLLPANAFDGDLNTVWSPDGYGWHTLNMDWIGYQFTKPVKVQAILLNLTKDSNQLHYNSPSKVVIEAANSLNEPFNQVWQANVNRMTESQILIMRTCKVLWREFVQNDEIKCFRLITTFKKWKDANETCQQEGGQLAIVSTPEETKFIMSEIRPCGFTWIGLNDRKVEGTYVWANESAVKNYTNWNEDLNDDFQQNDNQDCVVINHHGKWSTTHCDNKHYFLCTSNLDEVPSVAFDKSTPNVDAPVIFTDDDWASPVLNDSAIPKPDDMPPGEGNISTLNPVEDPSMPQTSQSGEVPPNDQFTVSEANNFNQAQHLQPTAENVAPAENGLVGQSTVNQNIIIPEEEYAGKPITSVHEMKTLYENSLKQHKHSSQRGNARKKSCKKRSNE